MQQRDPQKLARIAGWFFIATILTSIPAALLYGPVLNHQCNRMHLSSVT